MNADDFLKMEYPQSVDLIKFYDTRQNELVKFASGLAAAVPTAILAFRAATPTSTAAVWDFTGVVAIVTGVSLLSIFAALVQNRLYFVYPARQVNAIRAQMYATGGPVPAAYKDLADQMYERVAFPVFVTFSSQTLQLTFVALQVGSFFGIAAYALVWRDAAWGIGKASVTGLVVAGAVVWAAAKYLSAKNTKTADEAVHGQKKMP